MPCKGEWTYLGVEIFGLMHCKGEWTYLGVEYLWSNALWKVSGHLGVEYLWFNVLWVDTDTDKHLGGGSSDVSIAVDFVAFWGYFCFSFIHHLLKTVEWELLLRILETIHFSFGFDAILLCVLYACGILSPLSQHRWPKWLLFLFSAITKNKEEKSAHSTIIHVCI